MYFKSNISYVPQVEMLGLLRAFDSDKFNYLRCNDIFVETAGHVCFEFEMLDVSLWDFIQKKHSYSISVKEIRPILHQVCTARGLHERLTCVTIHQYLLLLLLNASQSFHSHMMQFLLLLLSGGV